MAVVEKLQKKDREDLIDFINLVFSQAHCPHNFEKLLPKLYGEAVDTMPYHYAIRENGKLMSAIISYPYEMQVGDEILKMNGIGSVSAHLRSRGKGYMKQIMTCAGEDMLADGTDLSWLSGLRQRYAYFGYEICGTEYQFQLTNTNLRHIKGKDYQPEYSFCNFSQTGASQIDAEKFQQAYRFYCAQPVHALRSERDFEAVLRSWNAEPCLIEKDQTTVGYLVWNASDCELLELVLSAEADPADVSFSWLKSRSINKLKIAVPTWNQTMIRSFCKVAEAVECLYTGNYKIYHFEKVLRAFLKLKATTTPLLDGKITVDIEGESLQISVKDGIPSVCAYDGVAELSFSRLEAHLFFFGMQSPHLLFPEAEAYPFLQSWFPLSFGFSHLDAV